MKIRRKTEIRIQTERFLVVRKSRSAFFETCAECGGEMLAPEEATLVFGIARRAIYRLIEDGELHFMETKTGGLLVCADSFRSSEKEDDEGR